MITWQSGDPDDVDLIPQEEIQRTAVVACVIFVLSALSTLIARVF
jgi:hypothetical protein